MESSFAHLNPTENDDGARIVAEYEGFKTGQTIRVLDDAEEDGPFAGTYADDEGELQIEVVGAAKYGNERISFGIKTEHHDEFVEVDPANIEVVSG